jgi:hypothetical protein
MSYVASFSDCPFLIASSVFSNVFNIAVFTLGLATILAIVQDRTSPNNTSTQFVLEIQ